MRRSLVGAVRRLSSLPPGLPLPPDVDKITGICAAGDVIIKPCANPEKGCGAFATVDGQTTASCSRAIRNEIITLGQLLSRYGDAGGVDSAFEYEAANKQAAWTQERQSRGVGVTGTYVFNAGEHPTTGRDILLDAEDPLHSNWTRFLNHSAKHANLTVEREVPISPSQNAISPIVRFVVSRDIAAGDELLFDYGLGGFDIVDVLGFEE